MLVTEPLGEVEVPLAGLTVRVTDVDGSGALTAERPGGAVKLVVIGVNPGGAWISLVVGSGSVRKTVGKQTRLNINFLKSAAGGVVSSRQIFWLLRKDSRKVA